MRTFPTKNQQPIFEAGFSLAETMMAMLLISGAFVAMAGAIPMASVIHRAALERERAMALAQYQLEYFLTNPGPYAGDSGTTTTFANAGQFPPGYSGSYSASSLGGSPGLTVIVVRVTPPHAPRVELSAIDTTFSNVVP